MEAMGVAGIAVFRRSWSEITSPGRCVTPARPWTRTSRSLRGFGGIEIPNSALRIPGSSGLST